MVFQHSLRDIPTPERRRVCDLAASRDRTHRTLEAFSRRSTRVHKCAWFSRRRPHRTRPRCADRALRRGCELRFRSLKLAPMRYLAEVAHSLIQESRYHEPGSRERLEHLLGGLGTARLKLRGACCRILAEALRVFVCPRRWLRAVA